MTHNSSPIRRLLAALLGVVAMLAGSLALPARADDAKPAIGKHYVIGTDTTYAPFEMRDPASGDMVGIDMDLLRAIAADQGFTVDIKSLGFDAAVQALNARQVDGVMAGMSITPTRAQQYDFTAPYFNSGLQFTSAKGSAYTSLDSLKGKAVAVKTGTAGATYANSVKGKFGFTTTAYGQTADMVNAVAAGQAAAYIEDYPVVKYAIAQGANLQLVGDQIPGGSYGAAVIKGSNPEFLAAFDKGLKNLQDKGDYAKIVQKYLGGDATGMLTQPAKGKHYVIGTDTTFAPFEMRDPKTGDMVGIDMDLLRAIAKQQDFTVEIKSLGFDAAVQALGSKQVDAVMAGMSITDKRKQSYDFSDSYFTSGLQFASVDGSKVKSLDDLKGKVVAVKTGTAGADYAASVKDRYGFTTTAFGQTADMINDVKAGHAAAYVDDFPVVAYAVKQGGGVQTVGDKIIQEGKGDYGVAVLKGTHPEFVQAFNQGLKTLRADGQYDKITAQYLGSAAAGRPTFMKLVSDAMPALLRGLLQTIAVTAIALVIASFIGMLFGFFKVGHNRVLRWLATIYVAIFRGTPLLVQIFFFYFTVPQLTGLKLSAFSAGVLTLALNAGAYMTEIVRGGIQSVDPGQLEASRSLGLPYITSMRKVVLPQALKISTPAFINQFIITLKDTSLVAVIGLAELTYQTQQSIAVNLRSELWLAAAALYFIVITLLTWVSNVVDKKVNK